MLGALVGNPVADMWISKVMSLDKVLHSIALILCRWDFLWKISVSSNGRSKSLWIHCKIPLYMLIILVKLLKDR